MPSNQMFALMHLAWKRCAGDIFDVIRILLGGLLFMAMFLVFTLMNFINWFTPISATPVSTTFTQVDALYISATWGYVNAISFGLFIAIVVMLFEYTANFVYVCWYFDNCSWETPKQISKFFHSIWVWWTKSSQNRTDESSKKKDVLKAEIYKIKSESEPSRIKSVQPILKE